MAAALQEDLSLCVVFFVEFLLYRGKADLTVLDENKNTALHLACSKVLCTVGSAVEARAWYSAGLVQGRLKQESGLTCVCSPPSQCLPCCLLGFCSKCFLSVPLPQGHEKCALMILAETQDLGLINATNSALQM